jgi:hypothetical protein
MTPERAAELAAMTTPCTPQGDSLITVQQAILHACAEQRNIDAKIAAQYSAVAAHAIRRQT